MRRVFRFCWAQRKVFTILLMPKIEKWIIDKVLDAAKIEEVVGEFVTLRKAGVNMTGLCPFHEDHEDGNFIVRPSKISAKNHGNTYRCFKCDAKGGPVQFLMNNQNMTFPDAIRWLGKKYDIPVDDVPLNWTPPPPRPIPPPPPPLEMKREWVRELMQVDYNQNVFTLWYGRLPWNEEQRKRMKLTLWEYCVGCWRDGRVVFWQIDHNGVPRAAKLMKYEPDGHRYHEKHGEKNSTGWLYNQDGYRQVCDPKNHTILKPLFGSHLLKRYPDAKVNVVESEKTALIMANYYGHPESQLWLACGGLKFLSLDAMQPLIDEGRQVWLWPDKDGVKGWQDVADKLGSEKVNVYTKFFDACWTEEDGPKADVADIAIRMLRNPDWRPRDIKTEASVPPSPPLPPAPEGVSEDDWREHLDTMKSIADYETAHPELINEPFSDVDEMLDPRLHHMREVIRLRYNFKHLRIQ